METLLAKDPDFSNGWNFLGWLYNKQGRYKLAAIALLKAIEANPFDPYAYNNLGQALAGQKKYEEALPQYLKQIEINKGDVYAYGNLGRVYLELNQNQKAQDALEAVAALSAKPDPYVQFNLGRAYSRNNQPKKAVEAFQKSAEIEPIPNRYNSVAYELAINHLDLNIAQHYAESAIADTILKSRMTSLDHLTAEDVRLSAALPSYWDTLGWIRFLRGTIPTLKDTSAVPGKCIPLAKSATTSRKSTKKRIAAKMLSKPISWLLLLRVPCRKPSRLSLRSSATTLTSTKSPMKLAHVSRFCERCKSPTLMTSQASRISGFWWLPAAKFAKCFSRLAMRCCVRRLPPSNRQPSPISFPKLQTRSWFAGQALLSPGCT